MLDILNLYGHGFVAAPTILACRRIGLFAALADEGPLTREALWSRLDANSGHGAAAIRLLQSLGWIVDDGESLTLAGDWNEHQLLPDDLLQWWQFPIAEFLDAAERADEARGWFDRSVEGWQVSNDRTRKMLDGVLVIPLLIELQRRDLLRRDERGRPRLADALPPAAARQVRRLYDHFGWSAAGDESFAVTELGQFITDRALILGTVAAYQPMLSQLPQLLTGDAAKVFQRDEQGHEAHVERTLNVVGSGFQHEKFFADVDQIVADIFAGDPPPLRVCDMGCGDGSFLKRVHAVASADGQPGPQLIGADFNDKALQATDANLQGLPHLVCHGDIGDPAQLCRDLSSHGVEDLDSVLHIRSFLDHDRPLVAPADDAALAARADYPYRGVYVDPRGQAIPPSYVVQSLIEHLGRWSQAASRHGLVVLEVHSVPPALSGEFLEQSESLHFDAYHAYSMQHLVEADTFLMCAAKAQLFGRPQHFRKYPKTLPFCRITLNWFQRRDYRIRNAGPRDLEKLQALLPGAVAGESLAAWIETRPLDTFVVERQGTILGAALCGHQVEARAVAADAPATLHEELDAFLDQMVAVRGGAAGDAADHERVDAAEAALAASTAVTDTDGPEAVVHRIVRQLMEGNGAEFDTDKTFHELGLDSLDHMELATLVGQRLGIEVESATLFTHNTPSQLAAFAAKRGKSKKGLLRSLFSKKSS